MRRGKHRKIILGLVFVSMTFFGVQSNVGKAHAIVTSQVDIQKSIRDKTVLQGVQTCYRKFVRRRVEPSSYEDITSILTEDANDYVPLVSGSEGKGVANAIVNPIFGNNSDYNVKDDGLSCYELFNGAGSNAKPILEVFDKKEPSEPEATKEFLENMGYDSGEKAKNPNEECYSSLYTRSGAEHSSNIVCRNKSDGKLRVEGNSEKAMEFYIDDGWSGNKNELCLRLRVVEIQQTVGCSKIDGALDATSFHGAILDICGSEVCKSSYDNLSGVSGSTELKFRNDESGYIQQVESEFVLGNSAELRAVNYLASPGASYDQDSIRLDRPEQRILYQEYLRSYYGVELNCDEGVSGGDNSRTVHWFDYESGEIRDCIMVNNGNENKDKPTNGLEYGRIKYHNIDNMDVLIELLNSPDMKDYDEDEMKKMGGLEGEESADQANNPGEADEIIKDCRNSGAAKTLGWIMCAVLEIMGDASESFYEKMVEPSLRVRSYLFTSDIAPESSIPYTAWERFRDIANVVFAIFLLFVIFSQLTGVGIDNYGIKRILPRLIVAVVLINLSYLICMIFVDVSNIVGNGLQEMFNSFGNALQTEQIRIQDAYPAGTSEGSAFSLVTASDIVSIALIAGLATMWGSIWVSLGPFLVVTLIFAAIGVIITMVFLYFFLAVRQAAIIVLVVTSPLAVVCYFLPNTKAIFDRVVKLFRALLLVYPIAALLVGGGNYVAKLILATGGAEDSFFLAVTAMIMGIVPVLFLPGIIKSAIAFIPKFGEMFKGFEDRARNLSSQAKGAVMKSEPMNYFQRNLQLNRAKDVVEKLNKKGNLTGYQARKLAANASMLEKNEKEEKAARVYAFREKYKNGNYNDLEQAARKALDSGNERDSYGLLGAMNYIYGAKQTAGFISSYYGKKENDLVGEGSNNRRKSIKGVSEIVNTNSGILSELKENNKDIADMVASAGMAGDNPQSLADYTRKMANMEERKWLTQDPEAIKRASEAGVLRPETAASVLNKAQNPNSSYGGALKGGTRNAMVSFLEDDRSYSRDANGTWVPSTSQPAPGGNNANGAGTLNGGRAFDAGSGFNQRQANDWDRQQQSEDQWGG